MDQAFVVDAVSKGSRVRQRSTIGFPYMDMNSAIELARAIHAHVGLSECDDDQLAAWSNQSAKSSTFRVQVYAARTFGLLEGEGSRHRLAELGRLIVDPSQEREARVRAFLQVPLYNAIFDKYRSGVLPPTVALERDIGVFGVSDKQKGRARQVFERSAEQAGFFDHGKNRLVMPGINSATPIREEAKPEMSVGGGSGGGGGDDISAHDPLIIGLFRKLPAPKSDWPTAGRLKWLQTAANIFDLLYKGDDGGIAVTSARAERSLRPHDRE